MINNAQNPRRRPIHVPKMLEAIQINARTFATARFAGDSGLASDDTGFGVRQDRIVEAELCNACCDLRNLRVRVRLGIPGEGD
jgi:hypothetical protein